MSGRGLALAALALKAGDFRLSGIDLAASPGQYLVLLGPTGSGKTLLAETICGLRRQEAGSIRVGGREIGRLDPAARNIGYLPQDCALLPFLTVRGNISFGLAARRAKPEEIERRVSEMIDLLSLAGLEERYPAGLSGGEKQRVALARALVIEPDLLIMDEPLSALDEETGDRVMREIELLHRRRGTTVLHICHRLEEALFLADRIAFMLGGRIFRQGTPREILDDPGHLSVARFFRLPNLVPGEVIPREGKRAFILDGRPLAETDLPPGPAWAMIPPSVIRLEPGAGQAGEAGLFRLELSVLERKPGWADREIRLGDGPLAITVPGCFPPEGWPEGMTAGVSFDPGNVRLLSGGNDAPLAGGDP